ncbi:hypothetical protein Bca101_058721 [Brassica carinata]
MDPWVEKQERRKMKKMKKHCDMLQFLCDAEYGIPSSCPCGGMMVSTSVNHGFIGVQKEVHRLRHKVDEMAAEIVQLKELIARK